LGQHFDPHRARPCGHSFTHRPFTHSSPRWQQSGPHACRPAEHGAAHTLASEPGANWAQRWPGWHAPDGERGQQVQPSVTHIAVYRALQHLWPKRGWQHVL
jgi:hypothetical protein